jgi:Co/Zn/Cd efflux system component
MDFVVFSVFVTATCVGFFWSKVLRGQSVSGGLVDGLLLGFVALWVSMAVIRFTTDHQLHGGLVFSVALVSMVLVWGAYALFARAQKLSFVFTHGIGLLVGLFVLVVSATLHFQPTIKPVEPERVFTPAEIEQKAFEQAAMRAYRDMTRQLRAQLHDPKSYQEVSATNHKFGDKIRIRIQFRANNAFGVPRLQSALGEADKDGNNVRILEVN